jgi:hypothetical protein
MSFTVYQSTGVEISDGACWGVGDYNNGYITTASTAKGQLEVELRNNGSVVHTASMKLKDIGTAVAVQIDFSTSATESDLGSTDRWINYQLAQADLDNNLYSLYWTISGKLDCKWNLNTVTSIWLCRSSGHAEFELSLFD